MNGIKTIQQDVEFNFNGNGINGKENAASKIGCSTLGNEMKAEKSEVKSNIWSKLKNMWS